MTETAPTRLLDIDRVMKRADERYAELVGSPLHKIESRQAKAIAHALVAETNRLLLSYQSELTSLRLQLREKASNVEVRFLASAMEDLDTAVDKVAATTGTSLGAPGE